jgi:hypothetical protein
MHGKDFSPCVVREGVTMRLYHAIFYRVPFAVRLDEKRTAKALSCFFSL